MSDPGDTPAPPAPREPARPQRPVRRDTAALGVGSLVNGVLAYVFFALATHTLGAAEAAPLVVLWTCWGLAGAAVTFPLQHWVARTAEASGEGAVRSGLPRVTAAVTGLAGLAGLVAWLVREPLFGRADAWFPGLVSLVTLTGALVGVGRGVLAARHRFRSLAGLIAGENAVRCLAAAALAALGGATAVGYGIILVAASLLVLAWPSSLRLTASPAAGVRVVGFLSAAAAGQVLGQVVLTAAPVVLALTGGAPDEVTAMFVTLALFRAPYLLGLGLLSPLTGRLTRLVLGGDEAALARFRRWLLAATAVVVAVAGLAGATVAPGLIRVVFGAGSDLPRPATALVAIGSVVALTNLVLTVGVIARGRAGRLPLAWLGAAGLGVVAWLAARPVTEPLYAACLAFVAAETAGLGGLLAGQRRAGGAPSGQPAPGGG